MTEGDFPSLVPTVNSRRWDACIQVYAAMETESYHQHSFDDAAPAQRVWSGYIGPLMEQFGFSRPKGTQVIKDLERMGCIEIKVQGKRNKPTEVVVIQPPTPESFGASRDALYQVDRDGVQFSTEQSAKLDMLRRIEQLETTMEAVLKELNRHILQDHAEI